jgi:hypothetical protein
VTKAPFLREIGGDRLRERPGGELGGPVSGDRSERLRLIGVPVRITSLEHPAVRPHPEPARLAVAQYFSCGCGSPGMYGIRQYMATVLGPVEATVAELDRGSEQLRPRQRPEALVERAQPRHHAGRHHGGVPDHVALSSKSA